MDLNSMRVLRRVKDHRGVVMVEVASMRPKIPKAKERNKLSEG
jgi:hypothetical protein